MTEPPPPPPAKSLRKFLREWLVPFIVVVTVLTAFRSSIADWNDVPTQSMEPTILTGDRIAVNKLAYDLKIPFTTTHLARWGDPARGDIVILYSPADGTRLVKRVVGVPGDQVELRNNRLIVNGEAVFLQPLAAAMARSYTLTDPGPHRFATERFGADTHTIMIEPARRTRRSFDEVIVPADQYLVMGDNRDNSGDSRVFGFVPREEIVGQVVGTALSFDRNDWYRPRWKRFFRGIE